MNINQKFITQRDRHGDGSVIPLINVVFLMLIFFMVAGQIQRSDPITIDPPTSINEKRPNLDPDVLIIVGLGNEVYVNDQLVAMDEVESMLIRLFDESSKPDQFWVQIKADGHLNIASLRPLFSAIRRSGLTKVSVATQLGQE